MAQGKFVVLEGLDGSGITTQVEFLRMRLEEKRIPVFVTKEPSAGPAGAVLRLALARRLVEPSASGEAPPLGPETMALLFAADRLDHLRAEILPKLEQGFVVVSDRYYLSSFAYQSAELEIEWIRQINSKCRRPDMTVFLDVPVEACLSRIGKDVWRSPEHLQLYEDPGRLTVVREKYLQLIRQLSDEGETIKVVDGSRDINYVRNQIASLVKKLLLGGSNPGPRAQKIAAGSQQIAAILRKRSAAS